LRWPHVVSLLYIRIWITLIDFYILE
jgi:hypothetical protein